MSNSPRHVTSRAIHGDYFDMISDSYMDTWMPILLTHMEKCKHIKCEIFKEWRDAGSLCNDSFRKSDYFNYLMYGDKRA